MRRARLIASAGSKIAPRTFTTSCRCSQETQAAPSQQLPGPTISFHHAVNPLAKDKYNSPESQQTPEVSARPSTNTQHAGKNKHARKQSAEPTRMEARTSDIGIFINGEPHKFAAVLLRDLCQCSSCIDSSTKQKFFSTADIPINIRARATAQTSTGTSILWENDLHGYGRTHTTELSSELLQNLAATAHSSVINPIGPRTLWDAEAFSRVPDVDYEAYMQDDSALYKALQQLHKYGLLFVSNVPESETSVSTLGERIGAIKNTFYGYTWDVRSVPEAKNVAYTSQDLGFHMDLLYMHQPPHLQLLHCIRSSAKGGASLFTDSYRAAEELFEADDAAFEVLRKLSATYHYNHPSSHLYRQQRPVFEMSPQYNAEMVRQRKKGRRPQQSGLSNITEHIEHVAWSPPFQGPPSFWGPLSAQAKQPPLESLNRKVTEWHAAAQQYSALLHRPQGIYERLMRPGECVIFDNRRVLHARKAFEVGDAGTERWLRGAYLDKDPFDSKMQVLMRRFRKMGDEPRVSDSGTDIRLDGTDKYFESASN